MNEQAIEQAITIASVLWRSIPRDYKQRYARNIWEQFAAGLKASAYTSDVRRFVSNFELRFGALAGSTAEDRELLARTLDEARVNERAVLRAIRDQNAYIVLSVRVANDQRRTLFEKQQEETDESL